MKQLLSLVFLFVFVALAHAGNDPDCGLKGNAGLLGVRNGTNSNTYNFPWMLRVTVGNKICGGSILKKNWVLTSADCLFDNGSRIDAELFYASNPDEMYGSGVQLTIPYPGFTSKNMNGDVGLLKLTKDLDLHLDDLGSVCLPDKQDLDKIAGRDCILSGYGTIDAPYPIGHWPDKLQRAQSKFWKQSDCAKAVSQYVDPADNVACWGDDNIGLCFGDEGSPLVCRDDNRWVEYGVASFAFGPTAETFCHNSVFARTSQLSEWIWKTIAANSYESDEDEDVLS